MGPLKNFNAGTFQEFLRLPVLGDVEGPLEEEVGVVIIIEELGDSVVVAAGNHARGSLLFVDCKREPRVRDCQFIQKLKNTNEYGYLHSFA